ncbi:hypothetical protein CEY12_06150 [Chryseobacterium sp. T16E-39]|uniref:hypothetical protein n=1 Tax=Chryseobacterium sp. T16E-39 TaxID=2015076 RepID=UPI000B5B403E|nr:hypothetical protein [Chryseobacterium sp. T16E-39]ASK29710.1 hypothetical protein CEY12_06150 [Chryseobacterium sp. T16E-39]
MKISYKGLTRTVILVGRFAFKFPTVQLSHYEFLRGCCDNWKERSNYKYIRKHQKEHLENISPSYFCFLFGLLQIQARCEEFESEPSKEQKEFFFHYCKNDCKKDNLGWYNGKVVCLDYA